MLWTILSANQIVPSKSFKIQCSDFTDLYYDLLLWKVKRSEMKIKKYISFWSIFLIKKHTQSAVSCSKLTMKTLEQGVKYIQIL